MNQKSERMEWGHVKYHTVMQAGFAFEIVVQWVTSSGPIVWDLVSLFSKGFYFLSLICKFYKFLLKDKWLDT